MDKITETSEFGPNWEDDTEREDIELVLNEGQVDRVIAAEDKANVENFVKAWGSGNVDEVKLNVKKGEIYSLTLVPRDLANYEPITLSAVLFRQVFDGVRPYRKNHMDDPTGLSFSDDDNLNPNTSVDSATEVLSRVMIGGKKLEGDFHVTFPPASKFETL